MFSQKYNRKRHLAKHGVNEKGEKLTQDEQDRLLGYNKHKNTKKSEKSEAKTGTSTTVEDASTSRSRRNISLSNSLAAAAAVAVAQIMTAAQIQSLKLRHLRWLQQFQLRLRLII